MIPRETGRGLSIIGAPRVAAVERLVGATLVVALPRTGPPSADHCLGTTEPGGWSGDFLVADWDRRPERRLSGADWDRRPSGRREWRRGAATQPGNDATPQGTHKGCPYDHRELEVSKGDFTVPWGVGVGKPPLQQQGKIQPESRELESRRLSLTSRRRPRPPRPASVRPSPRRPGPAGNGSRIPGESGRGR